MNKYLKIFLTVVIAAILLSEFLTTGEVGYCESDAEFDYDSVLDEQLSAIDLEELDGLGISIFGLEGDRSLSEYARLVLHGDVALRFSDLCDALLRSVVSTLWGYLYIVVLVVFVAAICGVFKGLTEGGISQGVGELVILVSNVATMGAVCALLFKLLRSVGETIDVVYSLVMAAYPILLTIMSVQGDVASIAFYSPLLSSFSLIIIAFLRQIIMPVLLALPVFSIVGRLSDSIRLSRMTSALRGLADTLTGSLFGLFMTFMGVGGISAGTADGAINRFAKYFFKGYVPVLGVYMTDGLDMLSLSLSTVRSAIGVVATMALLSVVILPLVRIVLLSLVFRFSAALAEPLGATRLADILEDLAKCVSRMSMVLLGLGLASAMMLIFVVAV